ncbi:methyltransferase domain-containing protein [uncultured Psychroserpens sp.]|uniref:methyltransferase domain-containing protein n=1 Tax=uncultured Psychroserpens sp. TaxID=255436 RepID=UPI0026242A8C|nr:methyltransferase domain-containing protein [uncultured Psychroserpens sp.]
MENLDASYWNNRYDKNDDPWDLGEVSPPIKAFIDQLNNLETRILIPGGGNSYEAEYLFSKGFKNVYVVDVSRTALDNIKKRVPNFPETQLIHLDLFKLDMVFDLILEQTFFCALHPNLRTKYVLKMNELLVENGSLVGLLFNLPLYKDKPPFGGDKALYVSYFEKSFHIETMEKCYNSISQREGNELFFRLIKE